MINIKKIMVYVLVFTFLLPFVHFSGAVNKVSGNYIKDDNRLLYMYRSENLEETNKAILIKSQQQLMDYYNSNKEKYNLDYLRVPSCHYEIKSFENFVAGYSDEYFFNKWYLILLVTSEKSDLYYYRLNSVEFFYGTAEVVLYRDKPQENPKGGKVVWHTILEVDKRSFVFSAKVKVADK